MNHVPSQTQEVKSWLASQFGAVRKDVPKFEYTAPSIEYLHTLVTLSKSNTRAATIVSNDFTRKAAEYRSKAARIIEILKNIGIDQDSLSPNAVDLAHTVADAANKLDIRDTELSSFLVAIAEITLRKGRVDEQRSKVNKESKFLLDHTRKAIGRLTDLKRAMEQLKDDIGSSEALTKKWEANLMVMAAKEKQYVQQHTNFKEVLNCIGYSPEISHGSLVEMADQLEELGRKTEPIVTTLKSFLDLPPDTELAALAVEDKKLEYAAAETYLGDLLALLIPSSSP